MTKRLYRSRTNRVLAGVAGGLGDYFDIDPVIFRIIFVVLTLLNGLGLLLYLVFWIVIPEEGTEPVIKGDIGKKIETHARRVASEVREAVNRNHERDRSGARVVGALILIVLGLLFLAQNLFGLDFWRLIGPFIIILLGLLLILRSGRKEKS